MSADLAPTWSVVDLYPSVTSVELVADLDRLEQMGTELAVLFDRHHIGARGDGSAAPTSTEGRAADSVLAALDAANELGRTLWAYIDAHTRVDQGDEPAAAAASRLGTLIGRNRGLNARLAAWLASCGVAPLAAVSSWVADRTGQLGRLAERAEHQMSEAEESLAAELSVTGSAAWVQLHATVTGQLVAEVGLPGGVHRLPIGEVRNLATHADPEVRRAAYEAELRAWPTVAPACAAALNGVKGEAVALQRRRGWPVPLDVALWSNVVDRGAYAAMTGAVDEALPDLRRFLAVKSRAHGHDGPLPWWDLVAPLPGGATSVVWDDAVHLVRSAFDRFSPALAGLVDRAVGERWIDARPRPGKMPGASSMSLVGDRSLINLNWAGGLEQAVTLAHELGHAYHNAQLARRPALDRVVPMSLAETASIFCETLFVDTVLASAADPAAELALLDLDLANATQTIVDIRTRVQFEREVFARRTQRTLGVRELGQLMVDAQRDAFGDALDESTCHPYMWAVKRHYYTSHFYNWQYTFGLLLGLGLFARWRADPETFVAEYAEALSRAGLETAAELAARFGIDLGDPAFWRSSLSVVRGRIDRYEALVTPA